MNVYVYANTQKHKYQQEETLIHTDFSLGRENEAQGCPSSTDTPAQQPIKYKQACERKLPGAGISQELTSFSKRPYK